jgi:multidrug resistance efflux pump
MLVFLTLIYIALLFGLIKMGKVPDSKKTWLTIIPYELVLVVGFFIPMQWGAPAGAAIALTYSVAITPNVVGEVIEVPVTERSSLKTGDVLFRIDPTQYQAALDGLTAQLQLAETRLKQSQELVSQDAGSIYELQAYQAQVDGLKAQIDNARYNLEETVVRAPSDGYVTNVTLRPGARTANLPLFRAMAFIDTSETGVIAQVHQIHARYIEPGQVAEVTFKTIPGKVFPATVQYIVPMTVQGQVPTTGMAFQALNTAPGPFAVRLNLDDAELAANLPPGSVGSFAIYTTRMKAAHVIRRVMIRMTAIMNYVKPS